MCEFCDMYLYSKENARKLKKETGINTYFKAKLFEYHVKNRVRKGSLTNRGVKLVFCPTRGRKLSEVSENGK